MGGSLRDALLKAGVVTEERIEKAKASPSKKVQRQAAPPKPRVAKKPPVPRAAAVRSPGKKDLERQARELRHRVKAMLRENRLNDKAAELAFNFTLNNKIKKIHLTPEQQAKVFAAELSIVVWFDRNYLVTPEIAQEAIKIFPDAPVYSHDLSLGASENTSVDNTDEYADFPVPDDLNW